MNITKEIRDDHQAALTVEFETSELERAKRIAAKKIARSTKIPGFRPGKAPYNLVLRYVGESNVLEEAIDRMVEEHYPNIIEESEITPYGPGSLTNIASVAPPTFEFLVPIAPEVELGDYKSIELPYELEEVTEEEYDQTLENLRARQAEITTVEREAQAEDIVYVDISGTVEGIEDKLVDDKRVPFLLKDDDEEPMAWPFAGVYKHFIGMKKGDEKEAEYTYSEDEEIEEIFRGKTVQFAFVMDEVKSRKLPELNDDFAKSVGAYKDLAELDKILRVDLAEHKKNSYNEEYETELTDKLIELSEIKHPPQMLADEIDLLKEQLKSRLQNQGMNLEIYMATRGIDEDGLRAELEPVAEGRLKRNLVLMEIARKEEIKVSDEEVQEEVERTITSLSQTLPPAEAERLFSNQSTMEGLVSNVMGNVMFRKTLTRLRKIANGEEIEAEAEAELQLEEPASENEASSDPAVSEQEIEIAAEDVSNAVLSDQESEEAEIEEKEVAEIEAAKDAAEIEKTEEAEV